MKKNTNKPEKIKKLIRSHPFFGSDKDTRPVEEVMKILRGPRYEWKNGSVVRVEKDLKPRQ